MAALVAAGASSAACAAILGFEDGTLGNPGEGAEAGGDAVSEGGRDATLGPDGDAPADGASDARDATTDADGGVDAALDAHVDANVDAGPKQAFVTPLTFNGRLDAPGVPGAGGFAAGDARCMEAAQATFPGRTFIAWLSTSGTSAASRLAGYGPWYVGNTYLANVAEVTSGSLKTTLHQGPDGVTTPIPLGVWTGTAATGAYAGVACVDWTSVASGDTGEIGTGGGGGDTWTEATARGCDSVYHLYCFEK